MRDFLTAAFLFLTAAGAIATFASLFTPKTAFFSKEKTKLKGFFTCLLLSVAFFAGALVSVTPPDPSEQAKTQPKPAVSEPAPQSAEQKAVKPEEETARLVEESKKVAEENQAQEAARKAEKVILFNRADFVENYNEAAKGRKAPAIKDNPNPQTGNAVNWITSPYSSIVATMSELNPGWMTDVTMIASGDGTAKSGAQIIIDFCNFLEALDPSYDNESCLRTMRDLKMLGDKTLGTNEKAVSVIHGPYTFIFQRDQTFGNMLAAVPR